MMIRLVLLISALMFAIPADAQVQDIFRIGKGQSAAHVVYREVKIAPGEELVLGDFDGPGKVTYFYYTDDADQVWGGGMYQGLVLKVYWDNSTEPSIRVPLWNFFGAFGQKQIDYQTPLMQINSFSFMSYLPMPFSKHARFVLLNDGDQTYSRGVAWGIDYERDPDLEHETSRLHAIWNRSNLVPSGGHIIMETAGRGQYIGNFLQVNTNADTWWGEGETIFDIDGQHVVHSAGTEDEYGATWDFRHTFSTDYTGYIQMDDHQNRMYRWYIPNPVRFQTSLRVMIQSLNVPGEFEKADDTFKDDTLKQKEHMPSGGADFISVAFWYQEGAHEAPALPPYSDRIAATKPLSRDGSK